MDVSSANSSFSVSDYINGLREAFAEAGDPEIAAGQKAYLKGQFSFFGLKSPDRRALQRPFLVKDALPPAEFRGEVIRDLWDMPERELHYVAQELFEKYHKHYTLEDIDLLEHLITHNSWWDTVDFLASHIAGRLMQQFPEHRDEVIERWMASDHLWLQRTCLLFQLGYKAELDEVLLEDLIGRLQHHPDFFIRKAIGWILRSHARVNPDFTRYMVKTYSLSPLSVREAMKHL